MVWLSTVSCKPPSVPDGAGRVLVLAFRGAWASAWAFGEGSGVVLVERGERIDPLGNKGCVICILRSFASCGVECR